jgi:hypothetical protein
VARPKNSHRVDKIILSCANPSLIGAQLLESALSEPALSESEVKAQFGKKFGYASPQGRLHVLDAILSAEGGPFDLFSP